MSIPLSGNAHIDTLLARVGALPGIELRCNGAICVLADLSRNGGQLQFEPAYAAAHPTLSQALEEIAERGQVIPG